MKNRKIILTFSLTILSICAGTILISWASNLSLETSLDQTSQLNREEEITLLEMENLVETFGNEVFPGFGDAEIPTILYNSDFAFLIGTTAPADGWIKVPQNIQKGTSWESVSNEILLSQPYYRQPLPDPDTTPEAFTVRVGNDWVASIQTYDWMRISLIDLIRADLPDFARPIFPYRLFLSQLVSGQDQYITAIIHERLHAFQAIQAEEKFSQAEMANFEEQGNYPWSDGELEAAWKAELELLAEALREQDPNRISDRVEEFLAMRQARREQAGLSLELIRYEQQREWLEGLARYAELRIWQLAAAANYSSLPETINLSSFDNFQNFDKRWQAELDQFSRMSDDEGDGRFYYSGMAQAYLLDQLMPAWKERIFEDNIWLEDLLAEAIQE